MWPIVLGFLRTNAVYITLPVAAVIGFVGYNLENILSDKYTPYNSKLSAKKGAEDMQFMVECASTGLPLSESIQENRAERLTVDGRLQNAENVEKLRLREDVLERNLSPSLRK